MTFKLFIVTLTLQLLAIDCIYSPNMSCTYSPTLTTSHIILDAHPHMINNVLHVFVVSNFFNQICIKKIIINSCSNVDETLPEICFQVNGNIIVNFQVHGTSISILSTNAPDADFPFSRKFWKITDLSYEGKVDYDSFFMGQYCSKEDINYYYTTSGFERLGFNWQYLNTTEIQMYYGPPGNNFLKTKFKYNLDENVLIIQEPGTNHIRFKYFENTSQILNNFGNNKTILESSNIDAFAINNNNTVFLLKDNGEISSYDIHTRSAVNLLVANNILSANEMIYDSVTSNLLLFSKGTDGITISQINTQTGFFSSNVSYDTKTNMNIGSNSCFYTFFDNSEFKVHSISSSGSCPVGQYLDTQKCSCIISNITNVTQQNQQIKEFKSFLSDVFQNEGMKTLNKIPGGRKIMKFYFFFFTNFDDLWLFQYHERNYGDTMNALFEKINNLEKEKWEAIRADKISQWVGINEKQIINFLDNKTGYTSPKFLQTEEKGQGFLPNALFYITINLPLILLVFLLMRFVFFRVFNYRISIIFRPFSFWGYLILMLLDGNVQYFYFLFFNQARLGFSFNFHQKMINLLTYFLFYVFLVVSIGSYFIYYALYKKLCKYCFEFAAPNIKGAIALCIINTVRNFVFGGVHNFLRWDMSLQITTLVAMELLFLILLVILVTSLSIFSQKHAAWINIIFSCLRIAIIVLLFIQQTHNDQLLLEQIENCLQFIIKAYYWIFLYGVIFQFVKQSFKFFLVKELQEISEDFKNQNQQQQTNSKRLQKIMVNNNHLKTQIVKVFKKNKEQDKDKDKERRNKNSDNNKVQFKDKLAVQIINYEQEQ